ncbi:MAG TPA: RNA polymerase subunit sigma-70 [Elusimicrobia bacterium]|nr:MAG: hypothetical protein A3K53_10175 [Deltaproteobacteria bacterium RIFOXYB2_FULL_66_7]HAH06088.1 RNA polymerase subunit sigma-70 [Elusimicrobiota bacterium]
MEGGALEDQRRAGEKNLVLRAKAGDEKAFAELIALHGKAAYRLALAITGDPADAEDAAQDAFLRAFRALERFDAERPFGPWILKIAANRALTRAGRRRRERPLEEAMEMPEPTAVKEDLESLRRGLDELDPLDRSLLALRYEAGLSVAAIAEALGIREGAAKVRLFRARQRLMGSMKEGGA